MADQKLTALTADGTPVGADLFYIVDDVAGTPTSKKITLANLALGIQSLIQISSASASLTGTTPNSVSAVQWGTEEAVVAQADCPTAAVVLAWVSGGVGPGAGTPAVGDRGALQLQVSFDGGSNFANMGVAISSTLFSTSANRRTPTSTTGRATGTVTGDIQVRAMINDTDQANDTTWANGVITVLVHPQ